MIAREPQLLDACGLINIVAGGCVNEIAAFFGGLVIVEDVAEEAAEAVADASCLTIVSLTSAESDMLVELARIDGMDAGEAATFAVATSRSLPVVTDDRRAIRAAADHVPRARVHRTASVLRAYVEGMAISPGAAAAMLRAIEVTASFRPRGGSPDATWWALTAARASSGK